MEKYLTGWGEGSEAQPGSVASAVANVPLAKVLAVTLLTTKSILAIPGFAVPYHRFTLTVRTAPDGSRHPLSPFLARTIHLGAGIEVEPDPVLGAGAPSPPVILRIHVTDTAPDDSVPSVPYRGRYYSVNDSPWDRTSFVLLNLLFQTAIGEIPGVGLPITIST